MRTTRNAWVLAAAALTWAGTAAAGTVYLPLAINGALAGKTYRSFVSVTNGSGAPQDVAVRYIPQDTAGLVGNGSTATSTLRVGPGQTFKLAVGQAGVGMVELSGADDVIYSGRLESLTPGGLVRSSAHLPVIGSGDLVPAGVTAHVQWGERAPGATASHFGLTAFGDGDGTCTVEIFRADGSRILSAVTLWAPAHGQRWFPDAFAGLQESSISDARFEVTCDVPFFPFTTILGTSPDSTQFVAPSATGGGVNGPRPSNANELVRLDGKFFTAVNGDSIKDVVVPIPARVRYGQLVYEFDVVLPRLVDFGPGGRNFHSTTLLLRPVKNGTHLAHTIRGNEKYKSILDLGVHDDALVRGNDGAWAPNARHHVRVDYDVDAGRMTWELSRNGTLIERLVATLGVRDFTHRGEGLHILFGLDRSYDHEGYLPPYGAEFWNLVVTGRPPG